MSVPTILKLCSILYSAYYSQIMPAYCPQAYSWSDVLALAALGIPVNCSSANNNNDCVNCGDAIYIRYWHSEAFILYGFM